MFRSNPGFYAALLLLLLLLAVSSHGNASDLESALNNIDNSLKISTNNDELLANMKNSQENEGELLTGLEKTSTGLTNTSKNLTESSENLEKNNDAETGLSNDLNLTISTSDDALKMQEPRFFDTLPGKIVIVGATALTFYAIGRTHQWLKDR